MYPSNNSLLCLMQGVAAANNMSMSTAAPRRRGSCDEAIPPAKLPTNATNATAMRRKGMLLRSVSTFAATPIDNASMAPLQNHTETQSVTTLNLLDRDDTATSNKLQQQLSQQSLDKYQQQQQQQHHSKHKRQTSGTGSCHSDSYSTAYSTTYSESSTQNSVSNGHGRDEASAKSVFTPKNEDDLKSFEKYVFANYITDMELDEDEAAATGSNADVASNIAAMEMRSKRISLMESIQSSDAYAVAFRRYRSVESLKHSSSTLSQLEPGVSSVSIRNLSPLSRKSASSSSSGNNTAKHEQSTAAATAAAAAAASTEKEKKRKEVSSSRVKKFHRHFSQVSKDEKLINYFSCALVSDILLQGHLYITDQHFAFYSNVFGYVTKVVIPTSSVTKISKEKTAKIIPNAVGVATADERHVFGSFISREAAFRLMCSVCPPLAPAEILPKVPADIEISEEYSIEDDSSCSISGNESPPQALAAAAAAAGLSIDDAKGGTLVRRNVGSTNTNVGANDKLRHSDIPVNANSNFAHHPNAGVRASAPAAARYNSPSPSGGNNKNTSSNAATTASTATANGGTTPTLSGNAGIGAAAAAAGLTMIVAGTASSTTSASSSPTPSTSSSPPTTVMVTPKSAAQTAVESFKTLSQKALLRLKFPTELHVVYLGVLLTMVLALFSVFLLYRILDIEAKTSSYRTPIEFNWRTGNDDDIFAEALRWQKELQAKNSEEAQSILTKNLEQIAKVRRSLETLSMLIHDRSSAYANHDDSD